MMVIRVVLASVLVGVFLWEIASWIRSILATARRMHQIPCWDCRFCSDDPYLKCAVHPDQAQTEAAIECADFVMRSKRA